MSESQAPDPAPDQLATKPAGPQALPPVEPPSAAFILQLFLIPLTIVVIIVAVWLMFSWLAHMGSDPQDLVRDLQTLNEDSWRKAYTLSNLLRNPENDKLKDDAKLCQSLADVLKSDLRTDTTDKHRVRLRVFLCRTLGEFRVANGLPVLLQAARGGNGQPQHLDVRYAALEAIAVLGENVGPDQLRDDRELMNLLLDVSRETGSDTAQDRGLAELRSTAAFALGVLGGPAALDRLHQMLDMSYPNARYNAALGLARHGDARSERVLLEMLDPGNQRVIQGETSDSERQRKRELVMMNAIRAVVQLARQNPQADVARLQAALGAIREADVSRRVRLDAREALVFLSQE